MKSLTFNTSGQSRGRFSASLRDCSSPLLPSSKRQEVYFHDRGRRGDITRTNEPVTRTQLIIEAQHKEPIPTVFSFSRIPLHTLLQRRGRQEIYFQFLVATRSQKFRDSPRVG